jgi:hypothetical protein
MTEAEWLACQDPKPMLEFLRTQRGEARRGSGRRKLRLFACACLRGIWPLLRKPGSRQAVLVAERFADGEAGGEELRAAYTAARAALAGEYPGVGKSPYWQSAEAVSHVATRRFDGGNHRSVFHTPHSAAYAWAAAHMGPGQGQVGPHCSSRFYAKVRARQALHVAWLRDIFSSPFRPVAFDPAWRSPAAVALARSAYEERRFEETPLLADALEEAGCADAALLSHLRGPGPHVRGCWAVDLVLGKE